jgi:LuxR family maltose regulon positive regulatory protein
MAHQTSPILTTKLFVARPQTTVVQREGLIARLDDILRRKITLISAPAGFGKTTAIGTWIAGRDIRTAWVSLDTADNDVARFLLYLVAAFQTIHPEVGEGVRRALLAPALPPIETLLASLINDLATITDDYLLVLDDYHLISDQEVHDALLFILERAPASLHTILTTRADPPVPLARLRVRGDLLEIRASDLRFSQEEASRFLNEQMGLQLNAGQLDVLLAKTEGWAAGLQMAALSLQGRTDIDGFISTFTGADRFVIDYLLEEVLALLPEELQRIMLELSMLDRFNGSLCEAVTGCGSGSELLADLERRNLFLVSLDNRRAPISSIVVSASSAPRCSRSCIAAPASGSTRGGRWFTPSSTRAAPAIRTFWSGCSIPTGRRCSTCTGIWRSLSGSRDSPPISSIARRSSC